MLMGNCGSYNTEEKPDRKRQGACNNFDYTCSGIGYVTALVMIPLIWVWFRCTDIGKIITNTTTLPKAQ